VAGNLPDWPVNVIIEDTRKPNLLYLGNDIGVFVSNNGGEQWHQFKSNMPPAAVTDMVMQPREGDLVVGTYGRGIWVTNVTPLREATEENLNKDAFLFPVMPKPIRREGILGGYGPYSDSPVMTRNEPNGLHIYYYLKQDGAQPVTITIADLSGKAVRTLQGPAKAGINMVSSESFGRFGGGGRGPARVEMKPGDYIVTLEAAGTKLTQPAHLLETPALQ
jgi:hypothetical protein